MEVAQPRHNRPIWMILWTILYVCCHVLYGLAMRYLKGGRLFEYMRLESILLLLWFWVCSRVLSTWNATLSHEKHDAARKKYHVQLLLIATDELWGDRSGPTKTRRTDMNELGRNFCTCGVLYSIDRQCDLPKAVGSLSTCDEKACFLFWLLRLCLVLATCDTAHNHEKHDSTKKSYHVQLLLIAMDQYRCGMEVHNQRNHLISPCPSLCKTTADLKSS